MQQKTLSQRVENDWSYNIMLKSQKIYKWTFLLRRSLEINKTLIA